MRFPNSVAIGYQKDLVDLVKEASKEISARLSDLTKVLSLRQDGPSEEIEAVIGQLRIALGRIFDTEKLERISTLFGTRLSQYNAEEINRIFSRVIGIPVSDLIDVDDVLETFIQDNVRLIKTIPENLLGEVQGIVSRGYRSGARANEIAAQIMERTGVSASRAKLIGRDQINKLYGDLTKVRQQGAGVERYIWRTSRDERVRATHRALEGKTFSWDEPPPIGHPGQDFRCRCTAEPILEDVLEKLGL